MPDLGFSDVADPGPRPVSSVQNILVRRQGTDASTKRFHQVLTRVLDTSADHRSFRLHANPRCVPPTRSRFQQCYRAFWIRRCPSSVQRSRRTRSISTGGLPLSYDTYMHERKSRRNAPIFVRGTSPQLDNMCMVQLLGTRAKGRF